MDRYSICVIDDKLPIDQFSNKIQVSDTSLIDNTILSNYILWGQESSWSDTALFNLIKKFEEQVDLKLNITGFKTHSFYLNHIEEYVYSPDAIIFDWDVGTSENQEKALMEILSKTYCLITIYTGCDEIEEVCQIIQQEQFKLFESRLLIVDKGEINSADIVIDAIKKRINYFSFYYGKQFRHSINKAINTAFSNIGTLSFNQFIKVFGEMDDSDNQYKISSIDFIEIMNDQIKAHLLTSETVETLTASEIEPDDILKEKKLWHFRMLHKPKDNIVRKGDIVKNKKEDKYYLIFSSDCHLWKFWSKNLGQLSIDLFNNHLTHQPIIINETAD